MKLKEMRPEAFALGLPKLFTQPPLLLQSPGLTTAPTATVSLQLSPATVSFAPTGPVPEDGLTSVSVGGTAGVGEGVTVGVSAAATAGAPAGAWAEALPAKNESSSAAATNAT